MITDERHAHLGFQMSTRRALILGLTCAAAGYAGAGQSSAPRTVSSANKLLASSLDGTLYCATSKGVYRSRDAGKTWQALHEWTRADAQVRSFSVSWVNPQVMYVILADSGLLGSTDGGRSWSLAPQKSLPPPAAVAAHATQSETVFAYVERRGFFRSEDGGRDWQPMDPGPKGAVRQFIHSNMEGSMQSGWLFAAASGGVRMSMDCFCGWRDAGDAAAWPATAVTANPSTPSHVAAATARGVFESTDAGQRWTKLPSIGSGVSALAFTADGSLYAASKGVVLRRAGTQWEAVNA